MVFGPFNILIKCSILLIQVFGLLIFGDSKFIGWYSLDEDKTGLWVQLYTYFLTLWSGINAVVILITEPIKAIYYLSLLFVDILGFLWYNLGWMWETFDATFKFSELGILYAANRIWEFFQYLVNDYDGFTKSLESNIWTVVAVLFLWPFYIMYYVAAYMFGALN